MRQALCFEGRREAHLEESPNKGKLYHFDQVGNSDEKWKPHEDRKIEHFLAFDARYGGGLNHEANQRIIFGQTISGYDNIEQSPIKFNSISEKVFLSEGD